MKEGKQLSRLLYMQIRFRERSHRKLKLFEKSFELEKQRIVNKAMEAENKAALANLETHSDVALLRQTSNAPIEMSEYCSNTLQSVTQNQVNNNNIKNTI